MTPLPRLRPMVSADLLYLKDAAYMARSDLHQTRLLGFQPLNIDAVTSLMLGALNNLSTVRHFSCASDEILSCLDDAGLQINEDMHCYQTGTEAEAMADSLIEQGKRLFWPYPLREGRFADSAHVVSPALWARLNSKEQLIKLVPADALPRRRVLTCAQLGMDLPELPAYLKAAGVDATGWGYAVRHVQTDDDIVAARSDFEKLGIDRILFEEAVDVAVCWCANLGVVDSGVTYLGAAEQTFAAPGKQSGSIIDPAVPFTAGGITLAIQVAEAAFCQGFRGICGLDIGLLRDGRFVVFDPNFRINSSTPQVLLYDSAVARCGMEVSASFAVQSVRPMTEVTSIIAGPIADGWFVPTRLIDQALLPAAKGANLLNGFVLAETRQVALSRVTKLANLLV